MNSNPFPILKTERLTLRKLAETDSDIVLYLRSDAEINKYIERPEHRKTKTLEQAKAHINKMNGLFDTNQAIAWAITLNDTSNLVGNICLWNFSEDKKTAEVGYDLSPAFQKKGIMSEAIKAILQFGFEMKGLEKIEAFTHFKNEASKKLLETNGFIFAEDRKDNGNPTNIIFEIKKTLVE